MQIVYKILGGVIMSALTQGAGDDPSKLRPVSMLNGHDTLIEYPLARMIHDQGTWQELWTLHKGVSGIQNSTVSSITNADARPAPSVDFSKYQVLIVFGGACPGVQSYVYVRTEVQNNHAVIRLAPSFFADPHAVAIMYPYIMLVIPKAKVAIDVDMETVAPDGTQGLNRIASYAIPKDK